MKFHTLLRATDDPGRHCPFNHRHASTGTPGSTNATVKVNILSDEYNDSTTGCSLREAIQTANDNSSFGGCLTLGLVIDAISLPAGTYN